MIQLKNFNLEPLDLSKRQHFILVNRLSNDEYTRKYISKKLAEFVKEPTDSTKLEPGKTYVIKDEEEMIGLLGTKELDRNNYLEPWVSIPKEFRGKKYGTQILEQITPYLIEHVDSLQDIKLVINKENFASKKVAEKVGYIKQTDESTFDEDTYRYFGK